MPEKVKSLPPAALAYLAHEVKRIRRYPWSKCADMPIIIEPLPLGTVVVPDGCDPATWTPSERTQRAATGMGVRAETSGSSFMASLDSGSFMTSESGANFMREPIPTATLVHVSPPQSQIGDPPGRVGSTAEPSPSAGAAPDQLSTPDEERSQHHPAPPRPFMPEVVRSTPVTLQALRMDLPPPPPPPPPPPSPPPPPPYGSALHQRSRIGLSSFMPRRAVRSSSPDGEMDEGTLLRGDDPHDDDTASMVSLPRPPPPPPPYRGIPLPPAPPPPPPLSASVPSAVLPTTSAQSGGAMPSPPSARMPSWAAQLAGITYKQAALTLVQYRDWRYLGCWALSRCCDRVTVTLPYSMPKPFRGAKELDLLVESLRLNSHYSMAFCSLGVVVTDNHAVRLHDGRVLCAMQLLFESLRLDPHNGSALFNLGVSTGTNEKSRLPDGRLLTSKELYIEALTYDPTNYFAMVNLAASLTPSCPTVTLPGSPPRTMTKQQLYIAAVEVNPDYERGWSNLAGTLTGETTAVMANGRSLRRDDVMAEVNRIRRADEVLRLHQTAQREADDALMARRATSLGMSADRSAAAAPPPPAATTASAGTTPQLGGSANGIQRAKLIRQRTRGGSSTNSSSGQRQNNNPFF